MCRTYMKEVNMDCLVRIKQLMKQQQISEYKLSKASGIPLSTINSLFHKGNSPTIPTLEGICRGLNITMSEFFNEPDVSAYRDTDMKRLLCKWSMLSPRQKTAIFELISIFLDE